MPRSSTAPSKATSAYFPLRPCFAYGLGSTLRGLQLLLPAEERSLSGGMAHYTSCQQDAFTFRARGKVTELRMAGMLLGTGL